MNKLVAMINDMIDEALGSNGVLLMEDRESGRDETVVEHDVDYIGYEYGMPEDYVWSATDVR